VTPEAAPVSEDAAGGKAKWEDSAAKREASLKERKAQMVLAARQYVFRVSYSSSWCSSLRSDSTPFIDDYLLKSKRLRVHLNPQGDQFRFGDGCFMGKMNDYVRCSI
jgi:hypothetical protein